MQRQVAVDAADLERPPHLRATRNDQQSASTVAAVRCDQDPKPGRVDEGALEQVDHDPPSGTAVQVERALELRRRIQIELASDPDEVRRVWEALARRLKLDLFHWDPFRLGCLRPVSSAGISRTDGCGAADLWATL